MNDTELIRQLKEQNKLFRRECDAAEKADQALRAYLASTRDGHTTRLWVKYTRLWNLWQLAIKARKATEPPF